MPRSVTLVAFVALGLVLLAATAAAQESRGTIFGTITDPQGAAVPAVQVTITTWTEVHKA